MNPSTIWKLRNLERRLSREHGAFRLFALLHRWDAPDAWDLVVSAPWLSEGDLELIAKYVHNALSSDELTRISRIAVLGVDDPPVQDLGKSIHIEGDVTEVFNRRFGGLEIDHGYILTSTSDKGRLVK